MCSSSNSYSYRCLSFYKKYGLDRGTGRTKQNTPSSKKLNQGIQTPFGIACLYFLKSIPFLNSVITKDLVFINGQLISSLASLDRFGEEDIVFINWRLCKHCLQSEWPLVPEFSHEFTNSMFIVLYTSLDSAGLRVIIFT